MKKYFMLMASLALLAACGSKQHGESSDAGGETAAAQQDTSAAFDSRAEAAKALVEAAYCSYINPTEEEQQLADESEINLFGIAYMGKYMTEQLVDLIVMTNDRQIATDELFLDYNIWLNAQDWDNPSLTDVSITECTDDRATAVATLTNMGKQQQVCLVLQYDGQKDAWLICDFLDTDTHASLAQKMEDYLSTPYED